LQNHFPAGFTGIKQLKNNVAGLLSYWVHLETKIKGNFKALLEKITQDNATDKL